VSVRERTRGRGKSGASEEVGISVCFKIEQRIQTKNTGDNAIKHLFFAMKGKKKKKKNPHLCCVDDGAGAALAWPNVDIESFMVKCFLIESTKSSSDGNAF
jgi:hypothetical protein